MQPSGTLFDEIALQNRWRTFLQESEKLSGEDATQKMKKTKGHYSALAQCLEKGWKHEKLNLENIVSWHDMIVNESNGKGLADKVKSIFTSAPEAGKSIRQDKVEKLAQLVKKLQDGLTQLENLASDPKVVSLMGETFYEYETIEPFHKWNELVGRLLVNYIASWFHQPPIVFKKEEEARFKAAHVSPDAMKVYLADKVREAVFDPLSGHLLTFTKGNLTTSRYGNESGEGLSIEWHDLVNAQTEWEKNTQKK